MMPAIFVTPAGIGSSFSWVLRSLAELPVFGRMLMLLRAPIEQPDMLWVALPMLLATLVMELYFGVYADEELGWNSAVGNAIFLVLVSLNLFRELLWTTGISADYVMAQLPLYLIAGALMLLSLSMLVLNFRHALPRHVAFSISSWLPVNLLAYLAVVLVSSNLPDGPGIPLDGVTAAAAIALLFLLMVFFGAVHQAVQSNSPAE